MNGKEGPAAFVYKITQIYLLMVQISKGELVFSSVGPVKLIHGHRLSGKMNHILAQYRLEGIFGFVCARFSKKYLVLFSSKHPILEAFFIKNPKTL